ncbi:MULTISPECIES: GAF domain-containing protein [Actinomycetes]|uniref:GAF domain-containing protein n=1 Tax=Actinomycetes TaxID=1760 RepID=UPI000A57A595|nr:MULTISPECIES: GAF domain-containing protein [Actinomycetes]
MGDSARLAQLARQLRVAGKDQTSAIRRIAYAAVEAIDGAEYASLTLVSARGVLTTRVAVGDLARQCDRVQQQLGQGPCLDAAAGLETVVWVDDMATETRWPEFAHAADSLGIAAVVCSTLFVSEDGSLGALNVHSTTPGSFDADARSLGELFAAHAAVEMASVYDNDQVRIALTTVTPSADLRTRRHRLLGLPRLLRPAQHSTLRRLLPDPR